MAAARLCVPGSLVIISTAKRSTNVLNAPPPVGGWQQVVLHRRKPEETLKRLVGQLDHYAITRLANITGLDRIGIPVWMAVRPNSRSLSVSQGKGFTHEEAKAGAICEAIETWYAEQFEGPLIFSRYEDLKRKAQAADPAALPQPRDSFYRPFLTIPWVEAEELISGDKIYVPYELVHSDATTPRPPASGNFIVSTNGLASGTSLTEATIAAVCEVIERDSHALWWAGSARSRNNTRVVVNSVNDAACQWLLERFEDADNEIMIWNMTSDLGVPAFRVLIYDRTSDPFFAPFSAAYGVASHPTPAVALGKALLEAAQSRLTRIAGSREDMTRATYQAVQSRKSLSRYAALSGQRQKVRFDSVVPLDVNTAEHALEVLLERLRSAGLDRVARIQLTPSDSALTVVRIIIPGLEGPSSSPSYVPGKRAQARRSSRSQ